MMCSEINKKNIINILSPEFVHKTVKINMWQDLYFLSTVNVKTHDITYFQKITFIKPPIPEQNCKQCRLFATATLFAKLLF